MGHISLLKHRGGGAPSRFTGQDACAIAVEIENGRRLFYRLSLHSPDLVRIDERDTGELLVTAFRDDWRGVTPRSVSDKGASSLIALETDVLEQLAIINQSRQGRVYATRKTRLLEPACDQTPLIAVLDRMLEQVPKPPFIAGVVLGDLDLVVLFLYDGRAVMGEREMQVSINPHSAESAAATFAAMHHLPPDVETRLFSHEELARALLIQSTVTYPRFATILGMPYQQAIGALTLATWVVAAGAGAWSGWEYLKFQSAEQAAATLDGQTAEASRQTGEALSRRVQALAGLTSLDTAKGLATAEALLPGGGKVYMRMSPAGDEYDALIPLRNQKEREGAALEVPSLERSAEALAAKPPEGCSTTNSGITGGMNDIKKSYLCRRVVGGSVHGW